ncbi:conserved hypothetical pox protein [Squirrelpox virus]|uniref:C5R n=1 Tax=Squirrelpox virus TaxID=240426 RepID=Q1HTQ8_9POXV|nr:conserved hypothetical pox protein [Squirrelpox virus]ABD51478.1 C5R [Squirrelpox virus]CCD83310.1 conserved hypothetical pox protein [Squirrelpox virus]
MRSLLFRVLPYFNQDRIGRLTLSRRSAVRVSNDDGGVHDPRCAEFLQRVPVREIVEELRHHFSEAVVPACEDALFQVFSTGQCFRSDRSRWYSGVRLLICLRAPSSGGGLIVRNNFSSDRAAMRMSRGMAVVLSAAASYDVTRVLDGSMMLVSLAVRLASMEFRIVTTGGFCFTNTPHAGIYHSDYIAFAMRLLTDKITGRVVCEQLMVGGDWFTVVVYGKPLRRLAIPAVCVGSTSMDRICSSSASDEERNMIVSVNPPYEISTPAPCIYESVCVGEERVVYGRVLRSAEGEMDVDLTPPAAEPGAAAAPTEGAEAAAPSVRLQHSATLV